MPEEFVLDDAEFVLDDAMFGPFPDGWTWGEQLPTPEIPLPWSLWKVKESSNDARNSGIWGKLQLGANDEFVSDVKYLGDAVSRLLTLTYDDYSSGSGSGTLYWRGRATIFDQDDDEVSGPTWIEYTTPANKDWQYIQIMTKG